MAYPVGYARLKLLFLLLVLSQVAHSAEEYFGRLWEVVAPARFLSSLIYPPDPHIGFLIANIGLVLLEFWCSPLCGASGRAPFGGSGAGSSSNRLTAWATLSGRSRMAGTDLAWAPRSSSSFWYRCSCERSGALGFSRVDKSFHADGRQGDVRGTGHMPCWCM